MVEQWIVLLVAPVHDVAVIWKMDGVSAVTVDADFKILQL